MPVSFLGNGSISRVTIEQDVIDFAEGQLAAAWGELEGEATNNGFTISDEILKERTLIQFTDALEAHSHHAIGKELGPALIVRRSQATR